MNILARALKFNLSEVRIYDYLKFLFNLNKYLLRKSVPGKVIDIIF